MSTREQDVFVIADQALCAVLEQIAPDQWAMPIPTWFQTGQAQDGLTVRAIVNYHAYDEAWVPDVLAGKTVAEVGSRWDGDLLGADPIASFRDLAAAAQAAARGLDDPERTVHLSYGDFPAREYLRHITSFRGFRTYDIAKLIGAPTEMPADLVQGLNDLIVPDIEQWRAMGVFPAAVPAPAGADAQTRLLCLSGREP
ncbi:MAG TPA: hypothetical protein VFW71_00065 [Actinomycetota bacterium]|nr:hypothetical protein [Actinomycetota bacterium]